MSVKSDISTTKERLDEAAAQKKIDPTRAPGLPPVRKIGSRVRRTRTLASSTDHSGAFSESRLRVASPNVTRLVRSRDLDRVGA